MTSEGISENYKSALSINKGVEQPSSMNNEAVKRFKNIKNKGLNLSDYLNGILSGDRTIISKAITLIESSKPEHHKLAQQIVEKCLPYSGNSVRIGITGVPGVGKSSFIESLGKSLIQKDNKIAVLAIDPSSEISKGSILGDKTRMEYLANEKNAFIRPSPSSGTLGGVARKTRETIILCEAAGFNTIFIETVGVGQSEVAVHSMVDFFLLLMLAGAGDELQGIKRGIMEMADMVVITKADGENIEKAEFARNEFERALHLFPLPPSGFIPKVMTCSAISFIGIDKVWDEIKIYISSIKRNSYFEKHRIYQSKFWMYETINEDIKSNFYSNTKISKELEKYEKMILNKEITSFIAAKKIFKKYLNYKK
ncbi:MAG: methylmalonyl Co-A mutase-associated GTPase MeaB [Bacteroidota bacterium]